MTHRIYEHPETQQTTLLLPQADGLILHVPYWDAAAELITQAEADGLAADLVCAGFEGKD